MPRDEKPRKGKRPQLSERRIRMAVRRKEIGRLLEYRAAFGIPTTDGLGLAMVLADCSVLFARDGRVTPRHVLAHAPGLPAETVRQAVDWINDYVATIGGRYEPLRADRAGRLLGVTSEEHSVCYMRTLYPSDVSTFEHRQRTAQDRKARDRERKRRERAGKGSVQRPIYEAMSDEARRPWEAFGISKSTWQRRGKPVPIGDQSASAINIPLRYADTPWSTCPEGAAGPSPNRENLEAAGERSEPLRRPAPAGEAVSASTVIPTRKDRRHG